MKNTTLKIVTESVESGLAESTTVYYVVEDDWTYAGPFTSKFDADCALTDAEFNA